MVVRQNRALAGAGLALTGEVSMVDCLIEWNHAVDSGGGAWFEGGGFAAIAMANNLFTANTAQNGPGGGLLLQNGDAWVVGCTFDHNLAAADFGGGVHIAGSAGTGKSWVLDGNSFSQNAALKGGGLSAASLLHTTSAHASGAGAPTALFRTGSMQDSDRAVPQLHAILASSADGGYFLLDLEDAFASQDGFQNPDTPAVDVVLAMARSPEDAALGYDSTVTIRWVKGATSYVRLDAIRTVNGAHALLDSVATFDPGALAGVTFFDALGRPRKGWGFSSAVTTAAIYVCTIDGVFMFDLAAEKISSFPQCTPSSDGEASGTSAFTAIAAFFDQGAFRAFASRV